MIINNYFCRKMRSMDINRLKIVLVEKGKSKQMVGRTVRSESFYSFKMVY